MNLALVRAPTHIRHDTRKQMQGLDVLKDVGRFVRDEENVEIFEWLVNVADLGGFDGGVLGVGRDELGEGRKKRFDTGPCHGVELPREDSCWILLSVVCL
ncbi:hypothetical protein M404DRAFT_776141 [Pisolithus tinctorius Marx 270]|uniref:Uncharacterized protein n=1 Tax=Pisolithus tinctorius Marx 270 TaxID=870435 RepID=A0A0C3IST6_PISTI|nr:hypothetical protein M404DRAFT_776141 [Pisolithus tinctorius Marx 270]